MTKRELFIIYDTINWATDQLDNIIANGPTDEKYWLKRQRRAQKAFDIVNIEISKRNSKRPKKIKSAQ